MKSPLRIGVKNLTLEEIREVAVLGRKAVLSPAAVRKIKKAHDYLSRRVESGDTMYGVNTGFGLLSNVKIPPQDIETLQYNLLRSHAVGVGNYLTDSQVRAMLLLRAANLAQGHSGVSLKLVQHILNVLNAGICPLIPEQGSVGASGDLAPLSHLALVLIGEGRARLWAGPKSKKPSREVSGAQALKGAGLKPIRLGPKEGLALINGTQFMTAIGTLALLEAEYLCNIADRDRV
jgi:histidine ammonia-lyase